nr:zinc metallopeptidase [Pleionea sp. CnH1-48]
MFLLIILGPGWWVKHVLDKYSVPYERLPGTGGELAQHLIDRFQLPVTLEAIPEGDHYDPQDKVVRLSHRFYHDRSLSAVAVAAHEVGHALQDAREEPLLKWRSRLAVFAAQAEKVGVMGYLITPFIGSIFHSPHVTVFLLLFALSNMLLGVIVHCVTLPVEWDASFNKALPILEQGEYLSPQELKVVKSLLRAAALTYVSGALTSLLNVWRWIAILRR